MKVLELGGGGYNRRLLALRRYRSCDVSAVDYSEKALAALYATFQQYHEQVNIINQDFHNLVHYYNTFDMVCSWGVIEHFDDPMSILRIHKNLARPGGVVVVSVPNLCAPMALFMRRYSPHAWGTHRAISKPRLQSLLLHAGLKNVETFYMGYPAFKFGQWEQKNLMTNLLDYLQKFASRTAIVLPYHRLGHRALSMELLGCGEV